MIKGRSRNVIEHINDLRKKNQELIEVSNKKEKYIDELNKKISEVNYELAIRDDNVHYLSNKLNETKNVNEQINDLRKKNKELIDKNNETLEYIDELKKKLNKINYNLAIKENRIHYLNNKFNEMYIQNKKESESISSINNTVNVTRLLEDANAELNFIKLTNMYKVWIRYRRLPEGIRHFLRGIFVPFKFMFRLAKKIKLRLVKYKK